MPKVTTNLKEFFILSNSRYKSADYKNGFYARGIIWVRTLNPKFILHELVHHLTKFPHNHNLSCSLILFFDVLNDIHDVVNGILFYKSWRKEVHGCINIIVQSFNDFLDWRFCREIDLGEVE